MLLPVPGFSSGPEEDVLLPVPGFSSRPEAAPLRPVPGFASEPEGAWGPPGADGTRPLVPEAEAFASPAREVPTEADGLAERERFSDTLVDVLREAARREGVEV